jgi:hypothetical protein
VQTIRPLLWVKLLFCAACLAACSWLSPAVPTPSPLTPGASASALSSTAPAKQTVAPRPSSSPTFTTVPTPDLVATVQAGSPAQVISSEVSPDGFWWARAFSHPCPAEIAGEAYGYDYLLLTDQRNGEERVVFSQLISCGGLGAYGLTGSFWSGTSRFYYFTNAAQGVPDGCGYWLPPLLRLDLTDWSITDLGSGTLSPNRLRMAAWLDGELVIWDLNGGRIGSAPPPVENMLPGPIAWAPNGQSIAYLLSEDYCPLGLTYVVRLNLSDFQAAPFFASQDPSFADLRWDTPNRVILSDENGDTWAYNFITGNLAHYQTP